MDSLNVKEERPIGLFILNLTLVGLIVSFSMMIYKSKTDNHVVDKVGKPISRTINIDDSLIEAKSVFVYDIKEKKVLYQKNPDELMPLASLVKIMTVYTARSLADKNDIFSVKKEDLLEEGDSGLLVGEKWTLKDISDFSLLVSSNDGSRMIASAVGFKKNDKEGDPRDFFISKMNDFAKDLGLTSLHFNNETGLDNGNILGGVGSSKDIAKLIYIVFQKYPDIFEKTNVSETSISSLNKIHKAVNTNDFIEEISGALASKTGFTDKAGGNLMTVWSLGLAHPVVSVVLGSTSQGRFKDTLYIASTTINQFSNN